MVKLRGKRNIKWEYRKIDMNYYSDGQKKTLKK